MARIAIVSQWLLGHLVPALGIGAELAERGHDVSVLSPDSFRPLVEQAGLRFVEVICGKYPHKFMDATLRETDEIYKQLHPDLVLCDSALSAPAYAAEKRGLPWVSYQTAVYTSDEHLPGVKRVNERMRTIYQQELNTLRHDYGLPPLTDMARTRGDLAGLSAELHLMLFLEELLSEQVELPHGSQIVGPCAFEPEASAPYTMAARDPQLPNVVVCTSSADKPGYAELTQRYVEQALTAFPQGTAQVYLVADEAVANLVGSTPDHVHWVQSFPNHHLLFPHADVIVTHGGCGTLQKAIRCQVPMVVIPLGIDHIRLAERCEELGIAKVMRMEAMHAELLQQSATQALQDVEMKQKLAQLSGKVDEQRSNRRAADEIEKQLAR